MLNKIKDATLHAARNATQSASDHDFLNKIRNITHNVADDATWNVCSCSISGSWINIITIIE